MSIHHSDAQEADHKETILFPLVKTSTLYEEQTKYFIDTIKLAIAHSDLAYEIEFVEIPTMPQSRSISLIQQGVIDINWLSTTKERETQLTPVRIPLLKGLLGLRIALINSDTPNILQQINSIDRLKRILVGQGHDWPDTKILQHHRFQLITASTTESLIKLIQQKRIDYFPRSILEVWFEKAYFNEERIIVDEYMALYYPLATYFFVRKDDEILQQQLTLGLRRAIGNGAFKENFDTYFKKYIERAQLDKREIFKLDNPFIPENTPLEDKTLWLELPSVGGSE